MWINWNVHLEVVYKFTLRDPIDATRKHDNVVDTEITNFITSTEGTLPVLSNSIKIDVFLIWRQKKKKKKKKEEVTSFMMETRPFTPLLFASVRTRRGSNWKLRVCSLFCISFALFLLALIKHIQRTALLTARWTHWEHFALVSIQRREADIWWTSAITQNKGRISI